MERLVIRHEWAPGSRISGDANAAARQLAALTERDGALHLDAVVVANEPEDAPLHQAFEWDDLTAAQMYRLLQAGHAVRSIRRIAVNTRTEEEEAPERVYIPRRLVGRESGEESAHIYVPVALARDDGEQADRMRMGALARIDRLVVEFQSVPALQDIAGDLSDLLMKYR